MKLENKIVSFPKSPGVYLFKDKQGSVIYVGKAKSLKKRVTSYFKHSNKQDKVRFLLNRAADIDFIITDTEKEALLLENTLIKKYHPRYNIQLRDDKTYLNIRIGLEHGYPGISILRRVQKDGAAYFGPYVSAYAARQTVDQVVKCFRIRSCRDREFSNRIRPCLEFDLGRCLAPCVDKISKSSYSDLIEDAILFLKGANKELISRLKLKMDEASKSMNYEEAAFLRDLISQIEGTLAKQKVSVHGGGNQDAIGFAREGGRIAVCVLIIRSGTLLDKRLYVMDDLPSDGADIFESFLLGYYQEGKDIPESIICSERINNTKIMESILSDKATMNVHIVFPKKGTKYDMARLAVKNALEAIYVKKTTGGMEQALLKLEKKLHLARMPEVIECLDITNLFGREAYGSLVTFINGKAEKTRYRLYSIRTLTTPDDYAMMREVIERRFANPQFNPPDLFLLDGGKGQLNIALHVLNEMGISDIKVAAIAKGEKGKDRVYVPGRKNHVTFKTSSPEFLLLKRIRDEAHRFGIGAHRKKRIKSVFKS